MSRETSRYCTGTGGEHFLGPVSHWRCFQIGLHMTAMVISGRHQSTPSRHGGREDRYPKWSSGKCLWHFGEKHHRSAEDPDFQSVFYALDRGGALSSCMVKLVKPQHGSMAYWAYCLLVVGNPQLSDQRAAGATNSAEFPGPTVRQSFHSFPALVDQESADQLLRRETMGATWGMPLGLVNLSSLSKDKTPRKLWHIMATPQ